MTRMPAPDQKLFVVPISSSLQPSPTDQKLLQNYAAGRAGEFEYVYTSVRSIYDIDEAAIVGLHVVSLDSHLAIVLAILLRATFVGCFSDCRNKISDFFWMIGIADVDGAHAGIEVAKKNDFFIKTGAMLSLEAWVPNRPP